MIAELGLASGAGTVIDRLATAHRSGATGPGTTEYKKLCEDLTPTQTKRIRDLADVAVHGDPEHWPGLAAPAVDALAAHLQEPAAGGEAGVASRVFRVQMVTGSLRAHASSLEQYERLAPVLKELATLLHHLSLHKHGASVAAKSIAEMLQVAPPQALDSPLQPLVRVFGRRIQDGIVSSAERRILKQMIGDQVLMNGQPVDAFRPIADIL